ncbi:hypothetical protein ACQCX2_12740 [Propionibacteriaceae bacterium Y1700]|uniref:hypothetical protein n=1 Tax=Microlunatus sp. Y1700 TaxID=3418487 RepID=UPI003DA797F8
MTTPARTTLRSPGMRPSRRVLLVLIMWGLVAVMTWCCLFPELGLPIGNAAAPPMLLGFLFLVVWIIVLLQISHKVPYGIAGILLILGWLAGLLVASAAADLYATRTLQPTSATVVAIHERDDSPIPTDFRFDDGSVHRGVWSGVTGCGRADCPYERLPVGTRVEVGRDPLDAIPPRGPLPPEGSPLNAVLLGLSAPILIGTSLSVIFRRRSLLQRSDAETEADKARTGG